MKITYALGDADGCGYFRAINPGKALRARGHTVHFINNRLDPKGLDCDILVLQRQDSQESLDYLMFAKSRGIRVCHEIDDSFHVLSPTNPSYATYHTGTASTKMMERICSASDAMIVSTPRLQDEYQRFNRAIYLCYNAIADSDIERFGCVNQTGAFKRAGEIRIGWAGSDTHRQDFALIVKPLCKIFAEYPHVRMIFVGADMRLLLPLDQRHRERTTFAGCTTGRNTIDLSAVESGDLATQRYYDLINASDFDIAVAPIESTVFNAQKSWLKIQEAGFLGIPTICSNFRSYRQYAQEAPGRVVLLADNEKDWYRHLKALIEDVDLRASLARANLAYVKDAHVMSKRVVQWEDAFGAILGRVPA
jgi:O-antigen biosynthesis protein